MSWHYALGGQQKGPVSEDEFNRLVASGVIKPDTLVWKEGWAEWRAYAGATGAGVAAADADTAVCAVSGRRLPKTEMLEFEGRWVGIEHKDEFFQRLREGVGLPQNVVYATFGRRFLAKLIDGLVLFAVNMLLGAVLGGVMFGAVAAGGPEAAGLVLLVQVLIQLAGIAVSLAYAIYFTRKFDATPGKKALGLRLLRADGSKLSKARITGRYFAEWVSSMTLLIGYLMAAFDKEQRRALHDRIADTRVIDVRAR